MQLLRLLPLLLLWTTPLGGCSEECRDMDGDGHGPGCDDGADCDDDNPAIHAGCEDLPPECRSDADAEGCPCLAGATRDCYSGPDETYGEGVCTEGRRTCVSGAWSECQGEVTPRFEQCNGADDDCDGQLDEDALSPCGGCNADCIGGVWGTESAPFELDETLDLTAIGELTLARSEITSVTVWVPSSGDSTVSKVDAAQADELARYRVAGSSAERIAVDYRGDAWVLTSALEGRSTLTKLAAAADRCVDRDGDGLRTSSGPDDVLPVGEDECVLLELEVGDDADYARSVSVDGTAAPDAELGGHVWVGLAEPRVLLELDGETGELLRTVELPDGLRPHGSVFDPWGALWVIARDGRLARVNPAVDPPEIELIEVPLRCFELESVASDDQGRLTFTGFACETVTTYDPVLDRWEQVETEGVLTTRGVALLDGQAWVTHTAGAVSRVEREPLEILETFSLETADFLPLESTAAAADSLGQLWFVSSMGGPGGRGLLTRFDPEEAVVTAEVPLGLLPRPLGDLAGTRRLGTFAPEGRTRHVFEGCTDPTIDPDQEAVTRPTDWQRVHLLWNAGVGSSVTVEARHAETRSGLADAEWELLGTLPRDDPPFDVDFAIGGVVELRLTLAVSGHLGAPRISQVGLEWVCPGPD